MEKVQEGNSPLSTRSFPCSTAAAMPLHVAGIDAAAPSTSPRYPDIEAGSILLLERLGTDAAGRAMVLAAYGDRSSKPPRGGMQGSPSGAVSRLAAVASRLDSLAREVP